MNSRRISLTFAVALAAALAGCGNKAREAEQPQHRADRDASQPPREWRIDRPAPATTQSVSTPLPVEVKPTLVKRGPAPLVYLVESPANVSVVDLNTEQRLASAPVGARTIVRIEPRTGVVFGDQSVAPGPLPADHQYGIYIESGHGSEIRNESVAPVQPQRRSP